MRTILLVDDDKYVRARVRSALAPHPHEFTLLEASHGEEAVQLLKERPVDLVITDLWMPVMDGFQVLVHLLNQHSALPVMVLSSREVWEGLQALGELPQVPCLPKLVSPQTLLFKVREQLLAPALGQHVGITLLGFLQILARERRTCVLKVSSGGRHGTIHVLAGELVHAQAAGQEGEEALFEILGWREPELHMMPALPELKLTIPMRVSPWEGRAHVR